MKHRENKVVEVIFQEMTLQRFLNRASEQNKNKQTTYDDADRPISQMETEAQEEEGFCPRSLSCSKRRAGSPVSARGAPSPALCFWPQSLD